MEVLVETFATISALSVLEDTLDARFKRIEGWQARLTGAMILLGAIGVGNLVKIWGG